MRVAALYDIHANLPALEAVLREVREARIDRVVIGGDVVPGPKPVETLECLRQLDLPTDFILGNGETAVLAQMTGAAPGQRLPEPAMQVVRWTAQQLSPEEQAWMASWPGTVTLPLGELGEVLFCHATPRDENEIFTRATAEERLIPAFEGVSASMVVCGHTHMQFDRRVGALRVVNAGSVGMPFGAPGADWLLLGPGVELRRTDYALDDAVENGCPADYPQASQWADDILRPRSEVEMLDLFSKVELAEALPKKRREESGT